MMRYYYDNGQLKEERNWKGIKLISKNVGMKKERKLNVNRS